jgi:outer membrane protein assembly factor BamB
LDTPVRYHHVKFRAIITLMLLVVAHVNAAVAPEVVVLTPTAELDRVPWQYTVETPAADWMQPDFNDARWTTGEGGFGNENTPGARAGTIWLTPDIWLRRTFVLTRLDLPPVSLMMHHDDDAEVYINGILAHRVRGFTQSYRDFPISEESFKTLRVGTNVIAVHCHQFRLGQYIDAGLIARASQKLGARIPARVESEILPFPGVALSPVADVPGVFWKYSTARPPANWNELTFDDSAWDEGESGFGTAVPGGIARTEWNTPDIWLRRCFVITNLHLPPLGLVMHHDEDAQVYLNGVLACSGRGFTAGYCEFAMTNAATKALVVGTNVLAVRCRQTTAGQYIDAGLFARDRLARKLPRNAALEPAINAVHEWPNFLGPTHDAVYHGPPLLETWPKEGPRRVWSRSIGDGWSSPVVGEGKLIVCHRQADDLVVDCLNPQTGENYWSFREENAFADKGRAMNGPRPTPAIKAGRVFVHNTDGNLICLNFADGKVLWSHATRAGLSPNATDLGCVSSPLVTDKAVILHAGGTEGSVIAYAVGTGDVLWNAFSDLPTMSSPVPAVLDGKAQVLLITRSFLRSLDPDTGAPNWQYATHHQTAHTLFGATPVVSGNDVFVSGWHGLAARVVRVSGQERERLWVRNDALSSDFATPIVVNGFVYGFHGLEGNLRMRCVALETGELRQDFNVGSTGTMIRCGKNILVQCSNGEMYLVRANPEFISFPSVARPLSRSSHSYPAIVNGYVYARDHRQIMCLDLRASK